MNRRKFLTTAGACLAGYELARYARGFEGAASMDTASDAIANAGGIRVNQIGYLPGRPKVASVSVPGRSFRVRSLATNAFVFEASLAAPHTHPACGDRISPRGFFRAANAGPISNRCGCMSTTIWHTRAMSRPSTTTRRWSSRLPQRSTSIDRQKKPPGKGGENEP